MLGDENNLRDKRSQVGLAIKDTTQPSISYTKTNKLVTALFMVTDIMDKAEPLRNTLRTLGSQIISDMHTGQSGIQSEPSRTTTRIYEVLSFLDIASSVNMISDMNATILKNEFLKLLESVKEYRKVKSVWVEEFLENVDPDDKNNDQQKYSELITVRHDPSRTPTRLGVQKASTLMSALKGVNTSKMSDRKTTISQHSLPSFDVLKKHRRADIISALNMSEGGLTLTDIKNKAKGQKDILSALASCGEKTLQRELVTMVRDGVLKKEGEKRWSRYSIN